MYMRQNSTATFTPYFSLSSFVAPFLRSFIYLFIYLFIHSFIHSFIHYFGSNLGRDFYYSVVTQCCLNDSLVILRTCVPYVID